MANVYVPAPNGLIPEGLLGGRPYAGATRLIPIASGYASGIGYGDLVTVNASGNITRVDTTVSTAYAAFALKPMGIFLGCTYTDPALKYKLNNQQWPAGTVSADAFAVVSDDPDIVMVATLTNASGVVYTASAATRADVGINIGYYQNTALVNTATGNSTVSLNYASIAVTAILPFRIIDVVPESALSDGTFQQVLVIYTAGLHAYRTALGL
jgi:hypothetical protein